eukprot:5662655-Pyramimonas_sp.AAC.1
MHCCSRRASARRRRAAMPLRRQASSMPLSVPRSWAGAATAKAAATELPTCAAQRPVLRSTWHSSRNRLTNSCVQLASGCQTSAPDDSECYRCAYQHYSFPTARVK